MRSTQTPPTRRSCEAGVNIDDDSSTIYGTIPYYNYYGYYSLPTPIYYDRGAIYHYSASKNDPSYFVSLIYKLTETQSLYITYDEVDAIHGQTNFGGIYDGNQGQAKVAERDRQPVDALRGGLQGELPEQHALHGPGALPADQERAAAACPRTARLRRRTRS
jgi:hypothetical protein